MFIFFDPLTRRVNHIVTMAPVNYREFLENVPPPNEDWTETDETIPFEEIEVLADKSVRRRQPMTLEFPEAAEVGVEFSILGVPEGTTISVNGTEMGVMDASGVLECTPETGGSYRFRFECSGYVAKEITIEAVGEHTA